MQKDPRFILGLARYMEMVRVFDEIKSLEAALDQKRQHIHSLLQPSESDRSALEEAAAAACQNTDAGGEIPPVPAS